MPPKIIVRGSSSSGSSSSAGGGSSRLSSVEIKGSPTVEVFDDLVVISFEEQEEKRSE